MAAGADPEGADGDLTDRHAEAAVRPAPVGDQGDGEHHAHHQHRGHREEGGAVLAAGGEDAGDQEADQGADQVAHAVEGAELAEVLLRNRVGTQPLVGRLGGVGGDLEQEVDDQQPEVDPDEGHDHQEERGPQRAPGDVGAPPTPAQPGPVGEGADHRLPDHRHQGAEALERGERRPLVGLAHHPGDDRWEHLGAEGVPEPADGDPVDAEQGEPAQPDALPGASAPGRDRDVGARHPATLRRGRGLG